MNGRLKRRLLSTFVCHTSRSAIPQVVVAPTQNVVDCACGGTPNLDVVPYEAAVFIGCEGST